MQLQSGLPFLSILLLPYFLLNVFAHTHKHQHHNRRLEDFKFHIAKRHTITHPEHANAVRENPKNALVHAGLNKRQDYSCGPGRPCYNGACCGPSGWCGYGPASCGTGCTSNCDATAECGQYASTPGKTCPLNVCCSEFGFCGTTSEFCATGCQSNCGSVNKPTGGGDVRQRIVGYYESWASGSSKCNKMEPEDLPASALTHLNFAFGFVNPGSYEIIPMPDTDKNLLVRTTALKGLNPGLEVWISIGGWSFNDNGTIWQPVFSDLASSQTKRAKFIDQTIKFMTEYGFDGVDLDWEYPGAPDRGGHAADTANYVSLLKEMNTAFKSGGKKYGLSFTAPTSYWYLRWFDLEKIHPNVDWINVMSYDLHGVWDATDPIGPQVLAHTNLTEIDLALDLFWRCKVPAEKVHLGIGFYGRSFQLKNAGCSSPGCTFSGPADSGPCTGTAGILSYKEIMSVIDATGGAKPVVDKSAAVNYLTYSKDQWISYDDKTTFQSKIDFGNNVGLSGMLIWAIDQDDGQYSALKAITGKQVLGNPNLSDIPESNLLPKDCYVTNHCSDGCIQGYKQITDKIYQPQGGSDNGRCGGSEQRKLCCPAASAPNPRKCYWYGDFSDCNGECHPGQVWMVGDNQGDNDKSCGRGGRAFCCEATNTGILNECAYGDCGSDTCPSDKPVKVSSSYNSCGGGKQRPYCCTKDSGITTCNWRGDGKDCTSATCKADQIEMDRDSKGDRSNSCWWGRQRVMCCNPPSDYSPFLPVPLSDLFPTTPPDSDHAVYQATTHNLQDPDENNEPFAWVVLVGPKDAVSSFSKRDDSHMELFDCPESRKGDSGLHVAKAVCVGDLSNCNHAQEGGFAGTLIKMPEHCTGDPYVRAVSWKKAANQTLPSHLFKRDVTSDVYEFGFDYKLTKHKRAADGDVYVRIDYSSQFRFWNTFVFGSSSGKLKRSPEDVVREFASDRRSFRDMMEAESAIHPETGVLEKRNWQNWMEHDRRALEKKWWSEHADYWRTRMVSMLNFWDQNHYNGASYDWKFKKTIFNVEKTCIVGGAELKAGASAVLSASGKIYTYFGNTLIGKFTDSGVNWDETYLMFGHRFTADLSLNAYALGSLNFDQSTFGIPTDIQVPIDIGDEFNIKGIFEVDPVVGVKISLGGSVTLSGTMNFEQKFESALGWTFPDFNSVNLLPKEDVIPDVTASSIQFVADQNIEIGASGTLKFTAAPYVLLIINIGNIEGTATVGAAQIASRFPIEIDIGVKVDSSCKGIKVALSGRSQGLIDANAQLSLLGLLGVGGSRSFTFWDTGMRSIGNSACYPFLGGGKMRKRDYIWDNTTLGALHPNNLLPAIGMTPVDMTSQGLSKRADGNLLDISSCFFCPGGGGDGDDDGENVCDKALDISFYTSFTDIYGNPSYDPDTDGSSTKRSVEEQQLDEFYQEFAEQLRNATKPGEKISDEDYWKHFGKALEGRAVSDWGLAAAPYGPFERRPLGPPCKDAGYPTFLWRPGKYVSWPGQTGLTVYDIKGGCTSAPQLQKYALTSTSPTRGINRNLGYATEHILELQTLNEFWRWVSDPANHQPLAISGGSQAGACFTLNNYFFNLDQNGSKKPVFLLGLGVFPNNLPYQFNNLPEFVVLEGKINGVKMQLFAGTGGGRSDNWMNSNGFSEQLTVLKASLLVFTYLRDSTVNSNFVAQVNRVGAGLDWLENTYIPSLGPTPAYTPYNLRISWNTYIQAQVTQFNDHGEVWLQTWLDRLWNTHGDPDPANDTPLELSQKTALHMLRTQYQNAFLRWNPF